MQFTHSGEKSRHPCPCMSNPGAGVSKIVYLRFSVKTDHWSMSWRLIPLLRPISIWSFFVCGCGVGWGVQSAVIVFCWGSGPERLSIAPILLALQRAFFNYYANGLSSANCFFLFLCRMLLALFAGFLVPSCPKLVLVFGECL